MASTQAAKYDIRVNPCYQIDFQNVAAGKTVSASKRRVRWRFGFSNREAITEGKVGTDCRGEEHEINLVWSLTSGKRQVYADGNEVHYSTGRLTDPSFETSWTMKGGHILKIVAYAAPPLFATTPGFRQFDLLLDGFSYFDMPKIYELGVRRPAGGAPRALALAAATPRHSYGDEDGGDFRRRRSSSGGQATTLEREPRAEEAANAEPSVDILSNESSSGAADLLDASAPALLDTPPPPAAVDEFAPVDVAAPLAPPAFQAVSHAILSQYGPTAAPTPLSIASGVLALPNESHTYGASPLPAAVPPQSSYYDYPPQTPSHPQASYGYQTTPSPPSHYQQYQPSPAPPHYQYQTPAPVSPDSAYMDEEAPSAGSPGEPPSSLVLTMQPLSLEEIDEKARPATASELDRAVHSLVNLDDISEKVVTPEQRKAEEKKKQNQPLRSKAAPPKAPAWHCGPQAKLGDIQKHAPTKSQPTREVMRTHAFDAAAAGAGMMVVYGAPSAIPDAPGFGAGAQWAAHQQQMQMQAYALQMQQQQQQHMMYQRQPPTYAAY